MLRERKNKKAVPALGPIERDLEVLSLETKLIATRSSGIPTGECNDLASSPVETGNSGTYNDNGTQDADPGVTTINATQDDSVGDSADLATDPGLSTVDARCIDAIWNHIYLGAPEQSDVDINTFECQWEIPKVYRQAHPDRSQVTTTEVCDWLARFVVLTGDEEGFECCTVTDFLLTYMEFGNVALHVMAESLSHHLALESTTRHAKGYDGVKRLASEGLGVSVDLVNDDRLCIGLDRKLWYAHKLLEAIAWTCSAIRLPQGDSATSMLWKSMSSTWCPETADHARSQLCPLEVWDPKPDNSNSSCWMNFFSSGVIAWRRLSWARGWGRGLKLSFEMMVQLSLVENFCQFHSGIILLGYRPALVPIAFDEYSQSI